MIRPAPGPARAKKLGLPLGIGLALLLAGCVAAGPYALVAAARGRGVEIGSASWCGAGICLRELSRGGVRAARATLGWDRVLRLREVRVRADGAGDGVGSGGGRLPLRSIRVEELVVEGLPLPVLRGEVWPRRRLEGEGVRIEGDTLDASFTGPFGPVSAQVRREGEALRVVASCECTLEVPELGDSPLAAEVQAEGRVEGGAFDGEVEVGGVRARVKGRRSEAGIDAEFELEDQPIASVYALFASAVPELEQATIRGSLDARGRLRWPGPEVEVEPSLRDFAVDGLVGPELRGGVRYRILDREGNPAIREIGELDPDWLPLGAMGRWLPAAVIAAEDGRFFAHPGYDVAGMLEAARANREAGRIERGGSTLSQQLAKNLFLDGSRSYSRKLRELLYAVELERELGKEHILELYLNVVEFGPGVYGARQAATAFFSKSPAGLTPEEAAFLAAILRNPRTAWKTQYQRGSAYRGRVDWILANMPSLSPEERDAAVQREILLVPGG